MAKLRLTRHGDGHISWGTALPDAAGPIIARGDGWTVADVARGEVRTTVHLRNSMRSSCDARLRSPQAPSPDRSRRSACLSMTPGRRRLAMWVDLLPRAAAMNMRRAIRLACRSGLALDYFEPPRRGCGASSRTRHFSPAAFPPRAALSPLSSAAHVPDWRAERATRLGRISGWISPTNCPSSLAAGTYILVDKGSSRRLPRACATRAAPPHRGTTSWRRRPEASGARVSGPARTILPSGPSNG